MINAKCCLCGSGDSRPHLAKEGFSIVKCRSCGMAYVSPRLGADELEAMYNQNKISPCSYYSDSAAVDSKTFNSRLRMIEQFARPGKLLDLGCSVGTLLSAAKARGWDAKGIDLNRGAVEAAKSKGLNAAVGTVKNAKGRFDAVVMNDVLEHLPEPISELKKVFSILNPGGVLFIATPDIGSFVARISGSKWVHLKPREHLHYFSRRTARILLEKCGFRVVRIFSLGRVRSLQVVIDRISSYSKLLQRIAKAAVPGSVSGRIAFSVNPGDEMGIIAVRPLAAVALKAKRGRK